MQASPYASYNQQPSANGCGGWLPIFAIIAIACLIVGYIQFHHFLVYQTYEQGRCTIQFGTVQTHSSKSGKSWTVDMGYTLSTQQGQQVAGTGYDLPATTFSSRADAQKIVESYPVGKQFPCWYNPQKPTSAALVLHSSSFLDFLRATFWFNIGFTVGLCLALFVILGTLYGGFYLPVLLMVRGIVTQGQVTGHVTRRVKRKRRTSSQIVYQRQDSSTTWASFEVEKVYPLGSWQPVIPSAPGSRSATIPIILIMSDEAIAHSVLVPCCHCCSPLG